MWPRSRASIPPTPSRKTRCSAVARPQTIHVCDACHGESPKWQGQCPHCGAWNSARGRADQPSHGGKRRSGARRAALVAPASGASRRSPTPCRPFPLASPSHRRGHGRAGSRARRRPGRRLGIADRGRTRHRQIDAAAAGRAGHRRRRARALCHRRRVGRAGGPAGAAPRGRIRPRAGGGADRPRHHPRTGGAGEARAADRRFHTDHVAGVGAQRGRRGHAAARMHRGAGAPGQIHRHRPC